MSHNDQVDKNLFSEKIIFFLLYGPETIEILILNHRCDWMRNRFFYRAKKRQCIIMTKYGKMYLTKRSYFSSYMVLKLLNIDSQSSL